MTHYAIPAVGTAVVVTLAEPYGGVDAPVPYRVSDVRERQLTLLADAPSDAPCPAAGVPCLIGSVGGGRGSTCEALIVTSSASMLIVDVARDPRQHPRYRRPCKVKLEVPGAALGVVEGVLEDISAGGIRVRTHVSIQLDQRVFVSVLLADTHPILALGEVRGVQHDGGSRNFIVRLQFTVMAPTHQARLALLLEWPVDEPVWN
jgi:PilZ domain